MLIKLNCQCGTRFSFDVEPVNGRMPIRVACPSCGLDGTDAANDLIAKVSPPQAAAQKPQFTILSEPAPLATAAAPQSSLVPEPPQTQKPRLRVAGAATASHAHATAAAPAPAAATGEMCNRHHDKPASAHCTVCKKPICPECMSVFGYLCSINCRYQAEQQGIRVPVYKFQKRSVEAREFRKGALITVGVIVVVFSLIAAWYWYDYTGSKPKLNYTLKLGNDREVHSQFLADNQLLIVSADRAYVHDIKADKDVWSTDLKDAPQPKPQANTSGDDTSATPNPTQAKTATQLARKVSTALGGRYAPANPTQTAARQTTKSAKVSKAAAAQPDDSVPAGSDDEDTSYSFNSYSDYGRPAVFVDAENIWICFHTRVKCLDRKTGEVKKTIPIDGQLVQFTPSDSNILLVTAPTVTRRLLTRIEIPSGNLTTNEVVIPRPSKKLLRGELPISVAPTASVLLHQELQDRENYRPQVIQTSSEFFASGENLVELRVRLVTPKSTTVDTMKKPGPTVVNGQLSASSNTKAVAEEIFNELKRNNSGGFKRVDESTYAVALRRYAGKDPNDWTGEIIGVPLFFSFKTVDVIVANKRMIAFDKQNKKLFEATLSYGLADAYLEHDTHTASPAVEMDNVLYFFDQGLLTAFELPTGNVRWRLPTVGISCIQADKKGMLYINTSSAAPEDIQYSEQIKMDKVDAIILKVDPKDGKTLWKSVNHGQQCFFAGKYLFTTSSFIGGLGMGNALRDALGMPTSGPSYFHIYRIDPGNGEQIWDYSNNKDGAPYQIDFQNNKIALNYGDEVRIMKILQIF